MNILLWVIQVLLALHTAVGAVWKFSHSAGQTDPSLQVLHGVWLPLSIVELICALALILPVFNKSLAITAPIAATVIAIEMLMLCVVSISSGQASPRHLIYWLVVVAICAFIAYGRFVHS